MAHRPQRSCININRTPSHHITPSNHYTSLNQDLRAFFHQKIYKIALDSGLSCPTRDGTKGTKGCYYCADEGAFYIPKSKNKPILEQIQTTKSLFTQKKAPCQFLAYFQSYTATYADVTRLEPLFRSVFQDPDIVGICIGTRPDCLPDTVLDLFQEIITHPAGTPTKYHWLEIGLQSSHNQTLERIGRGHTYADFLDAYSRAKVRGLRVCVHIILGLPDETVEMMRITVQRLVDLGVDGIKFHHLHILKNSVFETWYADGNLSLYTLDEYQKLLGILLPFIPVKTIIHRLIGDAPKDLLIAPIWSRNKLRALQSIERYLETNNIFQGSNLTPPIGLTQKPAL